MQRVRRKTPGYIQLVVDLILCDRIARRRAENSVDWTVVITQLSKPLLGSFDGGISHRCTIIGCSVIVRLNTGVVTVRIGTSRRGVIVRLNDLALARSKPRSQAARPNII